MESCVNHSDRHMYVLTWIGEDVFVPLCLECSGRQLDKETGKIEVTVCKFCRIPIKEDLSPAGIRKHKNDCPRSTKPRCGYYDPAVMDKPCARMGIVESPDGDLVCAQHYKTLGSES